MSTMKLNAIAWRLPKRARYASVESPLATRMRAFLVGIAGIVGIAATAALPAAAQLAIPHQANDVSITSLGDTASFVLDMGTIVERPELFVEVVPDAAHPDIEIEISFGQCSFGGGVDGDEPIEGTSAPSVGANSLSNKIWQSRPVAPYPNETCPVDVRVLNFGGAGAPAQVDVTIRAETRPPWNTGFIAYPEPETAFVPRWRDTTIYEEAGDESNGQGQFIWAGTDVALAFPNIIRNERRGLIAFDVTTALGPGAEVLDAEIILDVESALLTGSPLQATLTRIESNGFSSQWFSGNVDAPGTEFFGGSDPIFGPGATWTHRQYPLTPWSTPGADTIGGVVATTNLGAIPGSMSFESPALTTAVSDMYETGFDRGGFLIEATSMSISTLLTDRGIQWASGEHPDPSKRPVLIIEYIPQVGVTNSGRFNSGAVDFVGEGQNLRWIYDNDEDDVLQTDVFGQCTIDPNDDPARIPYDYEFLGSPSYEGLDCCTWQLDSPSTNTVGTGQAIFFVNVDPADPENIPGDLDGDGIRDLCDNCPYTPNGPLLGTCIGGTNDGLVCNAQVECAGGGYCSLSQDDTFPELAPEPPGDACPVPEPGSVPMLFAGLLFIVGQGRRPARSA